MSRRAEERANEKNDWSRKRKAEVAGNPDQNKKTQKKIRKLKYCKVEDDWGMMGNEIQDMEEREVARARFLKVDRSWAKIGTSYTQTSIRVWSELEVMARKIITSCLAQAQAEAEKRKAESVAILEGEASIWLESEEAMEEFAIIPVGWKPEEQMNLPEPNHEKKADSAPDGWKQIAPKPAKNTKMKFTFNQTKIHQFFKSRELIDFDKEIKKLEKEMLLEKKKMKEKEWLERKREEKRKQANIWAGEIVERVTSEAWVILLNNEEKIRASRLELAGWKSVIARVQNWTLADSNHDEETGQTRKRRMDNLHMDSPSKKLRGKQAEISNHQATTLHQVVKVHSCTGKHASTGVGGKISSLNQPTLPSEKRTVQPKIDLSETKLAPKSAPKSKKLQLQVKKRKWVKKKNGLFGWVTSISKDSGKPQETPPYEILNGGVGKTKKENFRTSEGQGENSAGSCPANLGGELEKESETGPAEELSNF